MFALGFGFGVFGFWWFLVFLVVLCYCWFCVCIVLVLLPDVILFCFVLVCRLVLLDFGVCGFFGGLVSSVLCLYSVCLLLVF